MSKRKALLHIKPTFNCVAFDVAFGGKADMPCCTAHVRSDPKRTLSKVRRDFFRSKLLSLVFVLNSTAAAINLHPLDERVVDCNNVCGDGAAVSVHIAEFQSLVTKSIDLPS